MQYGLYDEKTGKIRSYSKEEARTKLETRLNTPGSKEEKQKGMSDFLTGIHSAVRFESTSQTARDRTFGDRYKNVLSEEERKKQMQKSGTELCQKRKNAEALEAEEKKRSDKQTVRANAASERARIRLSDPDLKAISRFMNGNSKKDAALLTQYKSGGANRATALKEMIRRFMKIDPEGIDITSEKNIAANAEKLENLSEKLYAIQYLITMSPQTYMSLDEAFRDRFEIRYGKAKTVAAYYRLKKHVMKNEYYRTHLNKEIGRKPEEGADPEQKLLSELIWQAEGGLKLVLKRADNYIYDKTTENLIQALRTGDARANMQKLSEKLEKRRERIRKEGLNSYLDETVFEERGTGAKEKLNLADHARNIQELKLTGDPDKDMDSLTKIMDQLDTLEGAAAFREKNQDFYLLEQSDRQIFLCEMALAAKGPLKRMQEDLLFLGRLRTDGSIDTTDRTKENLSRYRKRYENDLKDYRDIMDMFRITKNQNYDPAGEKNPLKQDLSEIERTPELERKAKKMLVELTEDGFSDKEIYRRINEIYLYSVKLAGTEQSRVLTVLANRAKALWNEKRYLNLMEVQKKDPNRHDIDEELKSLEMIHKLRFGYYDEEKQKDEPGNDYTYEPILMLRNEAMEKKAGFRRPEIPR